MIPRIDRNDLLEGVAERDEGALRLLYRTYADVVDALVLHMDLFAPQGAGDGSGSDGSESEGESEPPPLDYSRAEKAIQDVFVLLWEAAPGFDSSRVEADTWLVTLGHRLLLERARYQRPVDRQNYTTTVDPRRPAADSPVLPRVRYDSAVGARWAELDVDSRHLLTAAYFGGFTVEELAKHDGRSPREITQALIGSVERLRGSSPGLAEGASPSPRGGDAAVVTAAGTAAGLSGRAGVIDDTVLLDYAFGTVPREQTTGIESFLDSRPAIARRVRSIQNTLAELVMSLEHPATSAASNQTTEDVLVARLRAHRRPPRPLRASDRQSSRRNQAWVGLGMAVALGLTVWLALGPLNGADRVERRIERYQEQPGALSTRLQDRDGDELGTLVKLRNGRLFVAFEERPADDATFQLWELRGERVRSLGVPDGRILLTPPVATGAVVSITLEPSGGSAEPTGEPLVELRL